MSELKLTFYSEGLADPEFRIKWPTGRTQMQASLVAIEKMALVNAINTNFIIANTPPGHRIYFPIGSPDASEHESVMERLKLLGDPFEGKVDTVDEVLVGLLRRRKVERKGYFIFGSTTKKEGLTAIFESSKSWYVEGWSFIFFIAPQEPPEWKNIIDLYQWENHTPQN